MSTKEIKRILKEAFPLVKFSVTQRHYGTVDVRYKNGPTEKDIEKLISHFKMGYFDGMTDSYTVDNRIEDIEQFNYIFVDREIEDSFYLEALRILRDEVKLACLGEATEFNIGFLRCGNEWGSQLVRRYLRACDLTSPLNEKKLDAIVYRSI